MKVWLFVSLACLLALLTPAAGQNRGRISIVDNGYREILISIGDDVQEDPALIDELQRLFTDTSNALYQITEKRAYFHNFTILIPKSWHNTSHEVASGETPESSDIVVDAASSPGGQADRPFTVKATPCAEPGFYIQLTDQYILHGASDGNNYGPREKVLVHEWAHFRYGVFDEYVDYNSDRNHFYAGEDGVMLPTMCTEDIPGEMINKDTGEPCVFTDQKAEDACRWKDAETVQGATTYASLMYRTQLDYVKLFCDDVKKKAEKHNSDAPTMQNNMCSGLSVWEVLLQNPDFVGINGPRPDLSTTPTFRVVQMSSTRVVLVLDTSGSMSGNRIATLGQGCLNYISSVIGDGDYLGIVWFSSSATIEKEITEVNNQTRTELRSHIPTAAIGGTAIGLGLLSGLDALSDHDTTQGGQLIVITDGVENVPPNIADVFDQVVNSGVIVHTIAFTNAAESTVDALAEATGGLSFLYSDSGTSNGLNEAFQRIGDFGKTDYSYTLLSVAEMVRKNDALSGALFVDSSLGRNTVYIIDYTNPTVNFTLTSPSGSPYAESWEHCDLDDTFKVYTCRIPDVTEPGEWLYEIRNGYNKQQRIALSVTSQPPEGEVPIVARTFWRRRTLDLTKTPPDTQSLYAIVSKSYAPVLHAVVEAIVESPNGQAEPIPLKDDGLCADSIANDGIYSAFYSNFTEDGRYNIKTTVNSDDATYISTDPVKPQSGPGNGNGNGPNNRRGNGQPTGRFQRTENLQVNGEPTGRFQRTETGGSFQLTNYIQNKMYYPPGAISDLEVVKASRSERTVTLQWTAVGAQLDVGQASFYELRMGDTISAVRVNFTDQTLVTDDMMVDGSNISQPQEAGRRESVVIKIQQIGDITYAFAVRAVDSRVADGDVTGPLSNVVSVSMAELPQASLPGTATSTASTTLPENAASTSLPEDVTDKASSWFSQMTTMAIIAGGLGVACICI